MSTHSHQMPEEKRLQQKRKIIQILRTVPYERGFHFYTSHGNYTGETATSLDAFAKKIQAVPAASVSYHLKRGDFAKWIEDTLGDKELTQRINLIELSEQMEENRKELLSIIQTRISALKLELPHQLRHIHS
jgi:hypothetical protein